MDATIHLARLENRLQLVRDRVASVALGYDTGLYLYGRGGVAKSYTVRTELRRLGVSFRFCNSRITGRGLFDQLYDSPDAIHVFEDIEDTLADRTAMGVLRSALWGQGRRGPDDRDERLVTWRTHRCVMSFIFTGGIILVNNRPLDDLPELRALKTRIAYVHFEPTDLEIAALMRSIAAQGYGSGMRRIDPNECLTIAEFLIEQSLSIGRQLDIRLLELAFGDYLLAEDCQSGLGWQELVRARLRDRSLAAGEIESHGLRAIRKAKELAIARQILELPPTERLQRWQKETGKSQSALYRRLAELARIDAL